MPHEQAGSMPRLARQPGATVGGGTERVYGVLVHHLPCLVVAMLKLLLTAGVRGNKLSCQADGERHGRGGGDALASCGLEELMIKDCLGLQPRAQQPAEMEHTEPRDGEDGGGRKDLHMEDDDDGQGEAWARSASASASARRGRSRSRNSRSRDNSLPNFSHMHGQEESMRWCDNKSASDYGEQGESGGESQWESGGESACKWESGGEWERYKRVVCSNAPAVLLLLLKSFRQCHYLSAEYLSRLLSDSNYLLLALKYLNQDLQLLLHLPASVQERDARILALLSPQSRIMCGVPVKPHMPWSLIAATLKSEEEREWMEEGLGGSRCCRRTFECLVGVLRVVVRSCKYSRSRLRTLVTYKAPLILRKVMALPNAQVQRYCLALFKTLAPVLGRKWKALNTHLLTRIYLHLPPTLQPDYLAPDPSTPADLEEEEAEAARLTDEFNRNLYPRPHATSIAGGALASTQSPYISSKAPHSLSSKTVFRVARLLVESEPEYEHHLDSDALDLEELEHRDDSDEKTQAESYRAQSTDLA